MAQNSRDVIAVWASPLKRAQETAEPIAAALGLAVLTDARLRERAVNFGGPDLISNGVPCVAITRLHVDGDVVSVEAYPSIDHLETLTPHRTSQLISDP